MMKLQAIKSFSLKKSQTSLQNSPLVLLIKTILLILPVIIILVCYYHTLGTPLHFLQDYFNSSTAIKNNNNYPILVNDVKRKCDIFKGEWVQNMEAPYYTNTTCWAIHEHQNCIKYGRPDTEFMKWKWKPKGCEVPVFEPIEFLEIVRGKSLAFVGDSVGRNHMQSLICLLSRVEYPIDVSPTRDERFKHWWYRTYNFTMATFWSPHLVKAEEADTNGPTNTGLFNLYLDEIDETWSTQIEKFDYVIISAGHWFFRPSMYFQNHKIIGCLYCLKPNVTDLPLHDGYKLAFRTVFRAINRLRNYKVTIFLRTFAPSHFENGEWNNGGNCVRTRPFRPNETSLLGTNLYLYMSQLEEFKVARRKAINKGNPLRFRLLDTTQAMLLRPDGHPSKYGHLPNAKVTLYNDCVHWCLPGPIDAWNDFLLEMLKSDQEGNNN